MRDAGSPRFASIGRIDGETEIYSRLAGLLLDYASRILVLAQADKLQMLYRHAIEGHDGSLDRCR